MPSNHLILCHPFLLPASIFPYFYQFSSRDEMPWRLSAQHQGSDCLGSQCQLKARSLSSLPEECTNHEIRILTKFPSSDVFLPCSRRWGASLDIPNVATHSVAMTLMDKDDKPWTQDVVSRSEISDEKFISSLLKYILFFFSVTLSFTREIAYLCPFLPKGINIA